MFVLLCSLILIPNWASWRLTEGHSCAEYVNGLREETQERKKTTRTAMFLIKNISLEGILPFSVGSIIFLTPLLPKSFLRTIFVSETPLLRPEIFVMSADKYVLFRKKNLYFLKHILNRMSRHLLQYYEALHIVIFQCLT